MTTVESSDQVSDDGVEPADVEKVEIDQSGQRRRQKQQGRNSKPAFVHGDSAPFSWYYLLS